MEYGWNSKAATPAITAAIKSVAIADTFLTIRKPVTTGTNSNHGEILKDSLRSLEKSATIAPEGSSCKRLAIKKIIKVIANDGTVVTII